MEVMKEWVKNIFILILALTFIEMLLPVSRMEKYIKFIYGHYFITASDFTGIGDRQGNIHRERGASCLKS